MYIATINPKVNKIDYGIIRSVFAETKQRVAAIPSLHLAEYLAKSLRKYFKIKAIANWLGVSHRSVYRLLDGEMSLRKLQLLSTLSLYLLLSDDYDDFIKRSFLAKIVVRS